MIIFGYNQQNATKHIKSYGEKQFDWLWTKIAIFSPKIYYGVIL